ncbi:MAG: DUF934 domain-containing protein [Rhodoferax sp.]
MKLIANNDQNTRADGQKVLQLGNDVEVMGAVLDGVDCVELHFPKFTDGRAFSQAVLLRKRRGFKGELRATGDVLIDQLLQMQRCGFDSAVLREDQNPAFAQAQLERYSAFYQGDAQQPLALFAREAA